jgi:hypothetical protein
MLWAMSSFAFFYVCVYALSSFYCLGSRSSWSLPVAIACAIAGTFSLASGQTIWFFGALYLAWQVWVSGQRSRLELVVWAVAGLLCLSIFHYQFTTLNTVGFMLGQLWLVPCHILGFFLAIVGSALSFGSMPAALAIGVLLTSGFIVLLIRDSQQKNLGPMHFFAAFLFASALVVALGRAPYSSLDYSLSDRYSFTSLNILLAMLVLVCNRGLLAWRGAAVTLLTAGLVLSAASYSYYTPQADEQVEKRLRQFEKARYRAFGYPHIETRAIVQSAIDHGLYHPPAS